VRQFSSAFHAISPQASRLVREILALPSVTTLQTFFGPAKSLRIAALRQNDILSKEGVPNEDDALSWREALN
jgi:hypothetical protein